MTDQDKLPLQTYVEAWCQKSGYTDPEFKDGSWYAYPPGNAVMKVKLEWYETMKAQYISRPPENNA
jgi:hypothetical protein